MARVVRREVEITLCDGCNKDVDYPRPCLRCGKAYCYECSKACTVEYAHAVSFSGSGDGRYCVPCDTFLQSNPQPLHSAYLRIANLRAQQKRMYDEWEATAKLAEASLRSIQAKESRG